MSSSELVCTYAALILHDDGISVTAEKISALVNAAGLTVESYWPSLFAKLASKRNIDDLILIAGSASASAAVAPVVPLSTASSADNAAPTPLQKKEEVIEESEDDMVFGLFD